MICQQTENKDNKNDKENLNIHRPGGIINIKTKEFVCLDKDCPGTATIDSIQQIMEDRTKVEKLDCRITQNFQY